MPRGAQSQQGGLTKVVKAMPRIMAKSGVKGWRMEYEPGKIIIEVASEQVSRTAPDDLAEDL